MPPTSTPKEILYIVVGTVAVLAIIGVSSLAMTLFFKAYTDPTILTAFVGITTGAVGTLSGLLINTRQPPASSVSSSVSVTSESSNPGTVTVEPQPKLET